MMHKQVKRVVLGGVVVALLALSLAGCGLLKQYAIGAKATVTGRTVQLSAELWEDVGSGLFAPTIHWTVDWGDGETSTEDDATPVRGSNWECTEPNRFLQWSHTYTNPGHYVITIFATNAEQTTVTIKID